MGLLWHSWRALGHSWGTHWKPLVTRWTPWRTILARFGHPLEACSTMLENLSKQTPENHFGGMTFGSNLGGVAHAIRTRLRSPNTHFALIFVTWF